MVAVVPLSPAIGAEVRELDLSTALSEEQVVKIKALWHQHLVLVFPDQTLTPQRFVQFAKHFGEIGRYPFVAGMEGHPEIVEVVKREDEHINFGGLWHTDTAYLEHPPMASLLYAVEVPPVGGDTLFANMYAAHDALSKGLQDFLSGLKGVNTAAKAEAAVTRTHRMAERPGAETSFVSNAIHPIVRTHPETGRKALYCSDAHVTHIQGMTPEESSPLLNYLYQVQQRPEFSCRVRWQKGTLALWDNRCAQHNALNDYHGHRRVMHRITLDGDRPA